MRKVGLVAALAAMVSTPAAAQQLRGVVRDSALGVPIVGAVVVAMDASGNAVSRVIADAGGRYAIPVPSRVTQLQVLRIGFRPRTVAVAPVGAGEVRELDVGLPSIPTFLNRVDVVAARPQCPSRDDAVAAGNLYAQAQAGLLATVVAREADPATVTRLAFDRTLDANGVRPVAMSVRRETADRATVSFNAARTAIDFVTRGFAADTGTRRVYFGPDADVLLDPNFATAYCFRIAEPDPARPALIGLGFSPARRRDGRVDIDGTLWIDTVARRLRSTEFRYLDLDEVSTGFGAGGTVSYDEVQPGVVLIDRWTLRLVGGTETTAGPVDVTSRRYEIHEVGGELASATWPDGRSWSASLGGLRLTAATASGTPVAPGAVLGLVNTDYRATVDSAGSAQFAQLVPGPYTVMGVDDKLAELGLTLPTELSLVAVRDSVFTARVQVPTRDEFVASLCKASGRLDPESAWLVGRVGTGDGHGVAGAHWRLSRSGAGGWIPVADGGAAGSSGLFTHCRNLKPGQTVQLLAWRTREAPTALVRKLDERLTVMPVLLPTAIVVRGGTVAPLTGLVLDSAAHVTVPGAYLEVVGTRWTAVSDSAGNFRMNGVPPGEYVVEVRTPRLDALDAVGRTAIRHDGRTPARIYMPTTDQLFRAMCGPAARPGTGTILGNVQMGGEAPAPNGVRLVAEWTDPGPPLPPQGAPVGRRQWLATAADVNGAFRLCGVPLNTTVQVRTQVDSGVDAAAAPRDITIDPDARFARLDLTLEAGLPVGASFAGFVISDSTQQPLGGVEVSLPDIGKTVATNADGAFRIDDIPAGAQRVVVTRPGFRTITAQLGFTQNQTIEHQIILGRALTVLSTVTVTEAPSVNEIFDANRKLGLGRFLTADDLDKAAGRNLSDLVLNLAGPGATSPTAAGHGGFVTGTRIPPHLPQRTGAPPAPHTVENACGNARFGTAAGVVAACNAAMDEMRQRGIYCPTAGEDRLGIGCACYAQVWVDGRLMNNQRPTEPFDINRYPPETLAGVEWYASPSQTPSQYSTLNAVCGVLALWTREFTKHPRGSLVTQER